MDLFLEDFYALTHDVPYRTFFEGHKSRSVRAVITVRNVHSRTLLVDDDLARSEESPVLWLFRKITLDSRGVSRIFRWVQSVEVGKAPPTSVCH